MPTCCASGSTAPPTAWWRKRAEILGLEDQEVIRRNVRLVRHRPELLAPVRSHGVGHNAAPLSAFLDWGHSLLELDVRTTTDRDEAVMRIGEAIAKLQVPRRIIDIFGELGHELLMNAMYDAGVSTARPRAVLTVRPGVTCPENRFIRPMNSATKRVAGRS